jgi:hypothetical protein
MLKARLLFSLLLLGCISAHAQVLTGVNAPPYLQVKAYLAFTDAQVSQIVLNLNDYGQLASQRQERIFQVQSEIQQETAKNPLDPVALGIRYAEIEAICRNVKDEAAAAQKRNLALLTDAQVVKLKALEDALKLAPIINEAQQAGLLAPPGPYGYRLISGSFFVANPYSVNGTVSGCQQTAVDLVGGRNLSPQATHVN